MKIFTNSLTVAVVATIFFSLLVSVILAQSTTTKNGAATSQANNATTGKATPAPGSKPDAAATVTVPSTTMQVTTGNGTGGNGSWKLQSYGVHFVVCGATFVWGAFA